MTEPDPVLERMRGDWDQRARQDAERYVYTRDQTSDEEDFHESGRLNYRQIIQPYLPILLHGRPARRCRVVEIGCGLGRITRWLAAAFAEVEAVDISAEMIRQARERFRSLANIRWHVGSGRDLRMLPEESCDFAFSYIVFQHIPAREVTWSYVADTARVLRRGAYFKFQLQGDQSAEYRAKPRDTWLGETFSLPEARAMLEAAGLTLVAADGAGTQYFTVLARKGPLETDGSCLLPGAEWAQNRLLEGWRPSRGSWRAVWSRSSARLRVPPGRSWRLFAGLYFGLVEPFPRLELTIAVNATVVQAVPVETGGDLDLEFEIPPGSVTPGAEVEVTLTVDPPCDPNVGPAVRCLGFYPADSVETPLPSGLAG